MRIQNPLKAKFCLILSIGLLSCGDDRSGATSPEVDSVGSVSVSQATASLEEGDTFQLTASVTSVSGSALGNANVTWTSSDPMVARVSSPSTGLTILIVAEKEGSAVITALSGGKSGTSNVKVTAKPEDVTGNYFASIGGVRRSLLSLTQTGSSVTFQLEHAGTTLTGSGTLNERSVTLATEAGPVSLTLALEFSPGSTSFDGLYDFTSSEETASGTFTGSRNPHPTYDVTANGLPVIIEKDYIDLGVIDRVSLFRSSSGHDFSDDFEVCRSMKHYFHPVSTVDWSSIPVYSPIDGTILGWSHEGDSGTAITIGSRAFPGVSVTIFHMSPSSPPSLGDEVNAGDALGTHFGSGTNSDIAVGIVVPNLENTGGHAYRLSSYFDVMADSIFQNYEALGASSRTDFIITATERDADPLTCDGEAFSSSGSLANWFEFQRGDSHH